MNRWFLLCPAALLLAPVPAVGDVLLTDDFEAYADTAALRAIWNESPLGGGQLSTDVGNPGQSLFHSAGAVSNTTLKRAFAPVVPTDDTPILWEFDFHDDGVLNKRFTGGLRTDAGGQSITSMLEMGRYDIVCDPETQPCVPESKVSGYAVRTLLIGADPAGLAGWTTFVGNPGVEPGWHHFKALIRETTIRFELDLQGDGVVDGQRVIETELGAGKAYNVARFGGPADLYSQGGGGYFDNVHIETLLPHMGDMDFDGDTDFDDITLFTLGLNDPAQYEALHGVSPVVQGDLDADGDQDFDDISELALMLGGGAAGAAAVPEPAAGTLLLAGGAAFAFVVGCRRVLHGSARHRHLPRHKA
jgi:hypothetical protein